MSRRFPVSVAPLGLVVGTGCSGADVVGSWSIVDLDQGGTAIELPYTWDDIENGQPVEVTLGIRLVFDEGGEGAWQTYYSYAYEDGSTVDDPFDYDTAWKRRGPRTFEVKSSGGIDLDMSCTVDESMDCEGEKDGGALTLRAEPLE